MVFGLNAQNASTGAGQTGGGALLCTGSHAGLMSLALLFAAFLPSLNLL